MRERARFRVYAPLNRASAFALGAVVLTLFLVGRTSKEAGVYAVCALLAIALGFVMRASSRVVIECGADGLVFDALSARRFVRWADVHEIEQQGTELKLVLSNGEPAIRFSFAFGRTLNAAEGAEQAALFGFARTAMAAHDVTPNELTERLARGGRARDEWLASFDAEEGFRARPIVAEDLWRVVEDPAAAPTARAGAAVALARSGEDERARLRVAADACVEPRLRVVLEGAASGDEVPPDALDAVADAKRYEV